jgi:hypothetical protein
MITAKYARHLCEQNVRMLTIINEIDRAIHNRALIEKKTDLTYYESLSALEKQRVEQELLDANFEISFEEVGQEDSAGRIEYAVDINWKG